MASSLEIDHKLMHDIRSAADASGYSRDHVTSLARSNKIVATQIGRQWYIDLASLKQYAHITELEQKVKQKHLGEDRRSNLDIVENLENQKKAKELRQNRHLQKMKTSVLSLSLLVGLMGGSLSYFAPDIFAPVNKQLASAPKASLSSRVAFDGKTSVPVASNITTTFSDGGVSIVTLARPEEAIVLLPEGLASSSGVFSDEVKVVSAENGEQRIVLDGDEESAGVPFVTVDIKEIITP